MSPRGPFVHVACTSRAQKASIDTLRPMYAQADVLGPLEERVI